MTPFRQFLTLATARAGINGAVAGFLLPIDGPQKLKFEGGLCLTYELI